MRRTEPQSGRWGRWLLVADVPAAAAVCAAMTLDVASSAAPRGLSGPECLVIVLATVPMAVRRRVPLGFALVAMAAAVVLAGPLGDADTSVLPVYATLVPAYSVAAYGTPRRSVVGGSVCLAGVVVVALLGPPTVAGYLVGIGMCIGSWTVGRWVHRRRLQTRQLAWTLDRLAQEQQDRERLAVAEEQARVARSLHEIVAKRVADMVVETVSAQLLLESDPKRAATAMAIVESAGRQVMAEMRHLTGALRGTRESAALSPQPGVGRLHSLVDRAAAGAGSTCSVEIRGAAKPLPPSVDLAVYRLVEAALASDLCDLRVLVAFNPGHVELQLTSRDPVASTWPSAVMAERIALCGGRSTHGPAREQSHRWTVRLPVSAEAAWA